MFGKGEVAMTKAHAYQAHFFEDRARVTAAIRHESAAIKENGRAENDARYC